MKIVYVPEGGPNLQRLFPEVFFPDVKEWSVEAIDQAGNTIATTNINTADNNCSIRVFFINSFGQMDALNFRHAEHWQESKSDVWERPQSHANSGGRFRANIKSEDILELETAIYLEDDLPYLQDFLNSPIHLIANTDKTQYLQLLITEGKIPVKTSDYIYEYQISIKAHLSNQRINLR